VHATPTSTAATRPTFAGRPLPTWVAPAAVGVGALGLCVLAGVTDSGDTWLPDCPFKQATGLDCPGCGMTRALRAVAHGDLGTAAGQNLLLVVALPVLLVAWGAWMARDVGLTEARPLSWSWKPLAPVVTGAILGFWVLRLLPLSPFDWLASGV
jgi:hypothetical protein